MFCPFHYQLQCTEYGRWPVTAGKSRATRQPLRPEAVMLPLQRNVRAAVLLSFPLLVYSHNKDISRTLSGVLKKILNVCWWWRWWWGGSFPLFSLIFWNMNPRKNKSTSAVSTDQHFSPPENNSCDISKFGKALHTHTHTKKIIFILICEIINKVSKKKMFMEQIGTPLVLQQGFKPQLSALGSQPWSVSQRRRLMSLQGR